MSCTRLSLFHYDVVRELCASCGGEKFHFVPIGGAPDTSECSDCGGARAVADLSDTSIGRLVGGSSSKREIRVVPALQSLPN
ncbi:MAG TPA: hypothetical protein VHL58_12240 [Thermoanaerobaculia bacterium]|nr:hypothetical protein [Thermoanaerobaculia bacterium]